jgi:hypothetical protein
MRKQPTVTKTREQHNTKSVAKYGQVHYILQ